MPEAPQPESSRSEPAAAEGPRERARAILSSGKPREVVRRELAKLRETELLRLMHEAAVMDTSPFWREIALRRFIREKGVDDGR